MMRALVMQPGGHSHSPQGAEESGSPRGVAVNTITVADICEWIWQNTLTTPGLSNRSPRLFPLGKRPRSKVLVRDNENTL